MAEETVTVALKHPHGLILKLYEMVEEEQAVMGGGLRTVKVARQLSGQVRLKGYSEPNAKVAPPATAGTFALTHNVPKAFWEKWLHDNADHPYVVNGLIFAHGTPNYVAGKAAERAALRCGLEPINPEKPPMAGIRTYEKDAA